MSAEKYLLVVSGPSGVGKDTVVRRLREIHREVCFSVSATTRAPREGEADGVDYYFLTKDQFEAKIAANEVVEYTCYCGNYYGTLRSELERRMTNGEPIVLVIEVEGAQNIKRLYPGCTTVFLLPPSREELRRRLAGRGTEDEETIARRLARADEELALADSYDYRVVNQTPDACAEEIYAILRARLDEA